MENNRALNSQYFSLNNNEEIFSEDVKEELSENIPTFVSSWSIEDDRMFSPKGLINHGNASRKTVFAVWSENYLLNFIFKRARDTQQISMTKARLAIPALEEQEESKIIQILVLKLNTLILMQSGRVYYFSSVKSMRIIPFLSGVRCISKSQQGFSVVRVKEDNKLCLETYGDVIYLGKAETTLKKSFDITFDGHNIFNCQWQDEEFSLLTQTLSAENMNFMELLIRKAGSLKGKSELHFFSVTGNVFVLIPPEETEDTNEPTDDNIHLLASYASCVELIKIHCEKKLCLIFLQCGTIDIWYISGIIQRVQHISYHTGTEYIHYDFSQATATFFYTDEHKVACLDFKYDRDKDVYYVEEKCKSIAGIQVCTWVEAVRQLVCLSCNNIFFQLNFDITNDLLHTTLPTITSNYTASTKEYENINDLYELTSAKVSKMLQKTNVVNDLLKVPERLHEDIEKEYVKQQLITVANRSHMYKKLFVASLEFMTHSNSVKKSNTVMLYTTHSYCLDNSSILAVINLKITRNVILETTLWSLHINYDNTAHNFIIPTSLLYNNLCIVIPIFINATHLLPTFNLQLLTFITDEMSFLSISLPIQLEINAHTYVNLFSIITTTYLSICNEYSLKNLIAKYSGKTDMTTTATDNVHLINHVLILPKSCNFENILKIFKIVKNCAVSDNLDLYFISHKLAIRYNVLENSILLESKSSLALYYAKLHLYYNLGIILSTLHAKNDDFYDYGEIRQLLLQYQCDIERCYGTNIGIDNNNFDGCDNVKSTTNSFNVENLKGIYKQIRTKFVHTFR